MPRIWLKVVFTAPSWKIGICMFCAKMLGVKCELYAGGSYDNPGAAAPPPDSEEFAEANAQRGDRDKWEQDVNALLDSEEGK
jgi:hypothetical protein